MSDFQGGRDGEEGGNGERGQAGLGGGLKSAVPGGGRHATGTVTPRLGSRLSGSVFAELRRDRWKTAATGGGRHATGDGQGTGWEGAYRVTGLRTR